MNLHILSIFLWLEKFRSFVNVQRWNMMVKIKNKNKNEQKTF